VSKLAFFVVLAVLRTSRTTKKPFDFKPEQMPFKIIRVNPKRKDYSIVNPLQNSGRDEKDCRMVLNRIKFLLPISRRRNLKNSIQPIQKISKAEARRFMLSHQGLLPPQQRSGPEGVLEFFHRVGCIQFDPVNVVERNPELVLQARISAYQPELLDDLLYGKRALIDGFDKVTSIYSVEDWPAFSHRRRSVRTEHHRRADLEDAFMEKMIQTVRERGPISSLDFEETIRINGYWGADMRIERFALERLLGLGDILIHHRTGSRRYYDLSERILSPSIYNAPDPFSTFESYQEWHVQRRIGGIGIAYPGSGESWLGISNTKSQGRWDTLKRLVEKGLVLPVEIEDIPERTFFMRTSDWQRFTIESDPAKNNTRIVFLGPLDNLLWDRDVIRWVFDFDYTWEVYKPATIRQYGPYTLPVLFGERFIARFDPKFDKKKRTLMINNWWWENEYARDGDTYQALEASFKDFLRFLKADRIQLGESLREGELQFLEKVM
jgi:uncharacterized protein YcaQ